jgi:hypothetical protein
MSDRSQKTTKIKVHNKIIFFSSLSVLCNVHFITIIRMYHMGSNYVCVLVRFFLSSRVNEHILFDVYTNEEKKTKEVLFSSLLRFLFACVFILTLLFINSK